MSTSYSPCAACKCLRRKCTQECVFAPYFPPDNPQKFTNVHKVFGASNVGKILNELPPNQREDAVSSLAYEAAYRLQDPVYGCVGAISILQHKLRQVKIDLDNARKELATYVGPSAMMPILNHPAVLPPHQNYGQLAGQLVGPMLSSDMVQQMMASSSSGIQKRTQLAIREPPLVIREPQQQQQQNLQAHQLEMVGKGKEMMMTYEQQQQQMQLQLQQQMQLQLQLQLQLQNSNFASSSGVCKEAEEDPVTASGFNQMPEAAASVMQPSLALGSSYQNHPYNQIQQQPAEHAQEAGPSSQYLQHFNNPQQLQLQLQLQLNPHDEVLLIQQQTAMIQQQQTLQQLAQPHPLHLEQNTQTYIDEEGRGVGPSS